MNHLTPLSKIFNVSSRSAFVYGEILKETRTWSYGSWIYNYLYSQCISPLTNPAQTRCTPQHIVW